MKVAVIGAGLTGLSAALHLKDRCSVTVFESSSAVGGLSKTEKTGGFRFDYTGHFLHFKDPANREVVSDILEGRLLEVQRKSFISAAGRMVPYPFQSNLYYLPEKERKTCLTGFLRAAQNRSDGTGENFYQWMLSRFGEGVVSLFMHPYNEKLWSVHPSEMTTGWMGRFVPRPGVEEVLAGALTPRNESTGYNAVFHYPPDGIGSLPDKMLRHLPEETVRTGCRVERVDAEKKELTAGGEGYGYDALIVTSPLNYFILDILVNPGALVAEAGKLRHCAVLNVNIGWEGGVSPDIPEGSHWVYFPEKKHVFYRAGFPSVISPGLAPRGASSCYTEISYPQGGLPDPQEYGRIEDEVIGQLREAGVIPENAEVKARLTLPIEPAYVIYDKNRDAAVAAITGELEISNIYCGGRYGAWEYSTMEDAIVWGKVLAEKCAG